MTPGSLRIAGIVCLVVCAVCLFVAFERYQTNANNVAAMNEMSVGFGGPAFGGGKMEPATPSATKYALLFALITGAGGAVCLAKSGSGGSDGRGRPPSGSGSA